MTEDRELQVFLLIALLLFLAWGLDPNRSAMAIRLESRWIIDLLGDRAFQFGTQADRALRVLLGPLLSEVKAPLSEAWVLGIRQILMRWTVLQSFLGLLLLFLLGSLIEARALRALHAARFAYTSPLIYRRIEALPRRIALTGVCIWLSPFPLHPLILPTLMVGMCMGTAARHALYMKQT